MSEAGVVGSRGGGPETRPVARLRAELARVIQGKPEVIELLLVGLLAAGHVLVEDVPGVGKTTLAKCLARALGGSFARVQFTPDLLPADILGGQILNPREGTFSFHRGPVFANVLLADEVNRASPRTQSALLEAMSEAQVTVDGTTHALPTPFFVVATQNPVGYQGTFPLPEAQLDRFLLCLKVGYPRRDDELAMLFARQRADPLHAVSPVATIDELTAMQDQVCTVEVKPVVADYLLRVVAATRDRTDVDLGASPRGALALFRAAQARAFLQGRRYTSPEDVAELAVPVLAHRLVLGSDAQYGGASARSILASVLRETAVPT